MEEITDLALVGALCALALLGLPADPFAVAPALGAIVLGCLCAAGAHRWVRAAAQVAFLALAVAWAAWAPFLPVAAYVGMRERPWALRVAWAAALAAILARGTLPPAAATSLCILCAAAAVLAVRRTRAIAERGSLRQDSDRLREQLLLVRERAGAAQSAEPEAGAGSTFDGLTERERAVVELVSKGLDNHEIAAELYLSEGTVRNHVSAVLQKMELKNRTQLAILYLTEGA